MKMEPIILLLGSAFLGDLMALFSYNYLKPESAKIQFEVNPPSAIAKTVNYGVS